MKKNYEILLVAICCLLIGILIILLPIVYPGIYENECGPYDLFCFEGGILYTILWIVIGIGIAGFGILLILYLIYWGN